MARNSCCQPLQCPLQKASRAGQQELCQAFRSKIGSRLFKKAADTSSPYDPFVLQRVPLLRTEPPSDLSMRACASSDRETRHRAPNELKRCRLDARWSRAKRPRQDSPIVGVTVPGGVPERQARRVGLLTVAATHQPAVCSCHQSSGNARVAARWTMIHPGNHRCSRGQSHGMHRSVPTERIAWLCLTRSSLGSIPAIVRRLAL